MNTDTEKRIKTEGSSKFAGAGHAPHSKIPNDDEEKNNLLKIFVGGLPNNITDVDLRSYFTHYGEVTRVFIPRDHISRMSRGFAFVVFENLDSVRRVCSTKTHIIKNKTVEVKKAEEQKGKSKMRKRKKKTSNT